MVNQNWLDRSMDDIVFENRNKSYGAYVHRQVYDDNMTKGILVAMVLCILFAMISFMSSTMGSIPDDPKLGTLVTVLSNDVAEKASSIRKPEPVPVKSLPSAATLKFVDPNVVEDSKVTLNVENVPTQEMLKNVIVGSTTSAGSGVVSTVPLPSQGNGTDTNLGIDSTVVKVTPKVLTYASVMPEYPDGHAAMLKYFYSEFDYPELAISVGVQGTLVVQFVVGVDGAISKAKILRGLGAGCDEEALRVINKMPKWKPGIHNERNVPVAISVPIKLVLK